MAQESRRSRKGLAEGHTQTPGLSGRERQILGLAAAGLLDKQIAADLGISLHTVQTYWTRIRRKLGNVPKSALTAAFASGDITPAGLSFGMPNTKKLVTELSDPTALRRAALYYATGFQRLQEQLFRASRAARVVTLYPQVSNGCKTEDELLMAVCTLIVEEGGYVLAGVGEPIHDKNRTIRFVEAYGASAEYLKQIDVRWDEGPLGQGPGGKAIRTGKTQKGQDFLADPTFEPWREAALLHGFQSSLVVPIKNASDVLGILSVYAREPDGFDDSEGQLFEVVAQDLAVRMIQFRKGDRNNRG